MRVAELVFSTPLGVDLGEVVDVLVEFVELDLDFSEEMTIIFLPFSHYQVVFFRVDLDPGF